MKKKCNRKKWALVNCVSYVIEGIKPTSGEKLDKLRMLELSAIEAFRTGRANIYDWQHITDMINVAEMMATSGVGAEVLPYCEDAQKHMLDAARRYQATKKLGLTGPGIQSLREVHEYHDLQRTSVPLVDYEHFIRKTADRIRSKAPEVIDVLEAA